MTVRLDVVATDRITADPETKKDAIARRPSGAVEAVGDVEVMFAWRS
jgi:hypothetical protein